MAQVQVASFLCRRSTARVCQACQAVYLQACKITGQR